MLTPPRASADIVKHIVKYKPGADSHRSFLFYSVSTSVSLKVSVNGVSLAPHPSLQALMEALPEPDLRVCSKTDRSHGPSAQNNGFLFPPQLGQFICFLWKHPSPGLFLHPLPTFMPLCPLPPSNQFFALVLYTIH